MKVNWNSLGGPGVPKKTFCEGSMDIFWNCTMEVVSLKGTFKKRVIYSSEYYKPEWNKMPLQR